MGYNDHFNDIPLEEKIKKCKNCGEYYRCEETEQIGGCKEMDEEICPHCKNINGRSMEWEYSCYKLTREEKEYLKQKGIIK